MRLTGWPDVSLVRGTVMKPLVLQYRSDAVAGARRFGRMGVGAVVVMLAIFAAAAPARAQYRPMPPDPYDPHAATLPAPQQGAMQPQQQQLPPQAGMQP